VTVYFDRFSGRELTTIDQTHQTAGDVFLVWLGRLHVGNFGGWPIKLVWFAAGLVFPLLAASGSVMWWNRFVRPRLRSPVVHSSRKRNHDGHDDHEVHDDSLADPIERNQHTSWPS
jgi:uncharacterized iron-regulated membrane protein